jgi:hypothetical protein
VPIKARRIPRETRPRMECRPREHHPEGHAAQADGSLTIKNAGWDQVQRFAQRWGGTGHRACWGNKTILVQFNVEKALLPVRSATTGWLTRASA